MATTDIQIQILQTGTITVRPSLYTQPHTRSPLLRLLHILTDRQWRSPSLPVYTFLITHPTDGRILFDTGMSPSCNAPGYFAWWFPAIKFMSWLSITPAQGIGAQLLERGISPGDLTAVVLSHLHHDHSGGLSDVAGAPVLMSKEHWETFQSPTAATLSGAAPKHWPRD
ncbi:N-acyl homoserine lactonase, partial [Lachnellula subtilissima]